MKPSARAFPSEPRKRVKSWRLAEANPVGKLESRWIAFITAIALFFGGWWLQNQYTTTLRVQEELGEFMRFADERYVEKDYLKTVTDRLERIEEKIDALASDRVRERGHAGGVKR